MSEWKEFILGSAIRTNEATVNSGYPYQEILYLDTGSISRGKINELQQISLADAPSRAKRLVKHGDIVYSTVRPIQRHYGYIKSFPQNLIVSTGFVVISCDKERLDSKFVYYYLASDQIVEELDIIAEASTSTYPSLKPSDIEKLKVYFPVQVKEQKAIAAVLSSLDDKIDLLHCQNKTLEAMAETLFRQWFVKEVGDWELGKLGDEFDFTMGQSPLGTSFNKEGIGVPMFQGNADFEFRFPKERVYTTEPTRFAQRFDTLISVRAPVGAQNMANKECCIGRGVAAFHYKNNNNYYTYTYFKLRSLMEEIKKFNNEGTVFGSISKSDFDALETIIHPFELIVEFEKEVKPINDKVIVNCAQIHTLETLRDTLLSKLMSGEVRVDYA